MKYILKKGGFCPEDFFYAYSASREKQPLLTEEEDCVRNQKLAGTDEYEYASLLSREKAGPGVTVETVCAFDHFGAPLIVLSEEPHQDAQGQWLHGHHYEIVAYEDGINVWHLEPQGDKRKVTLLLGCHFPVSEKEKHLLKVHVKESHFDISLDDHKMSVFVDHLPKEFYPGITACEGINRFYELNIFQ